MAAVEKRGCNELGKVSEGRLERIKSKEKVIRSRKKENHLFLDKRKHLV